MTSEWKTYRFDEISVNFDKKRIPLSGAEREKRKGKFRYYGAQGVIDYIDNYIFDGEYLLIAEDGENLKSKKEKIAQIAEGQFWVNNHAHIVQGNELCLTKYLGYLMNSIDVSGYITGSAQPKLSQANMNAITFNLPDLPTQRRIASVLSALDEKIAVNERINENLEKQSFFMLDQMLAGDSEGVCTISDIAELNPYRELKKNSTAKCIDMSRLSTSSSVPESWEEKPYPGGMKFKNGDTILARITPCLENGKAAYINCLNEGEIAFGSTEYIVMSPKDGIPAELLYCFARNPKFRDYAIQNMNGSSGRQRVSAEMIGKYEIPIFSKEKLENFKNFATSAYETIRNNGMENKRLATLRDSLLPRLMSGELDVSAVSID